MNNLAVLLFILFHKGYRMCITQHTGRKGTPKIRLHFVKFLMLKAENLDIQTLIRNNQILNYSLKTLISEIMPNF